MKEELEKYEKVNKATTLNELATVIRSFQNDEGLIKGRARYFNAEKMASHCEGFESLPNEFLTRQYGIRQQAMYIAYS